MDKFRSAIKSILAWLDRLHPVWKVALVVFTLFPFSPFCFPLLAFYFIWRWKYPRNVILRIGVIIIGFFISVLWSHMAAVNKNSKQTEQPIQKTVSDDQTADKKADGKSPAGPPELIDDVAFDRLTKKRRLNPVEMIQVLNKEIQRRLDNLGNKTSLIGSVCIGKISRGYSELDLDAYTKGIQKFKAGHMRDMELIKDKNYEREIPYPSYDILVLLEVDLNQELDPKTFTTNCAMIIAGTIGDRVGKADFQIRHVKYFFYRDPQKHIDRERTWYESNTTTGSLPMDFCRKVSTAGAKGSLGGEEKELFHAYILDRFEAPGTLIDRPRSIQEIVSKVQECNEDQRPGIFGIFGQNTKYEFLY